MIIKVFKQEVKKLHMKKSFLFLLTLVLLMTVITVFVYKDLRRIAITGAEGIERLSPFIIEFLPNISNVEFSRQILREMLVKTPLPIGTMFLLIIVFDIFNNEKRGKIIENASFYTHNETSIIYGKDLTILYLVCFVLFFQLILAFILSIPLLGITANGIIDLVKIYLLLIFPYTSILLFVGLLSLIIFNKAVLYLICFVGIVVLSIISPQVAKIHLLPTNIFTLVNQGDIINISLKDGASIIVVSSIFICLTLICTKFYLSYVRRSS